MWQRTRRIRVILGIALAAVALAGMVYAQGRGRRPSRPPSRPIVTVAGQFVFIGGYFYDPFFGPYPWWPHGGYPYPYFPIYDSRAELRLVVTPKTAAVYVDGFYAGIVDEFDGYFQRLPLPPGGHTIELYLEGFQSVRHSVYLRPASTLTLRDRLVRLAPGMPDTRPNVAPPVPPPPEGSYRTPAAPPPIPPSPAERGTPVSVDDRGTLELTVQPAEAMVTVDGVRWVSSDAGRFVLDLPAGRHRVEVSRQGYVAFSQDVDLRAGDTTALNVGLARSR